MNEKELELVTDEISELLKGKRYGAVFSLSRFETAIDFRLDGGLFLFTSVEPANPRIYLIRRPLKDLSKASKPPSPFLLVVRKYLSGALVENVEKIRDERLLFLHFVAISEAGNDMRFRLAIQMTGRSANLFLLNDNGVIIDAARVSNVEGQRQGDKYVLPPRPATAPRVEVDLNIPPGSSISEFLDSEYQKKEKSRKFDQFATDERRKLDQLIAKKKRLLSQLRGDLKQHGNADQWKRYGDLLLASSSTAIVKGNKVVLQDLYDEHATEIELEIEENESLTKAAEKFYKRYTKARNAANEIAKRQKTVDEELKELLKKREHLKAAIDSRDEAFFDRSGSETRAKPVRKKASEPFAGARRFLSSDGIEILVGKKAVDNDQLTFRVARSLDFWLHAADYPGSHVVVRNPNRHPDIPQKTLIESAQLAAFYSNAKTQPKAAVNYTQKKFVSKPKGGSPGLARLSRFKTILVEPQVPAGVTKKD